MSTEALVQPQRRTHPTPKKYDRAFGELQKTYGFGGGAPTLPSIVQTKKARGWSDRTLPHGFGAIKEDEAARSIASLAYRPLTRGDTLPESGFLPKDSRRRPRQLWKWIIS